jgi:Uma2 family endonuclease
MDERFLKANELGIRLEIMDGLPVWEPHPVLKHQLAVDRIRTTIRKASEGDATAGLCEYLHVADVYVAFPDGSLKRPDVAIFCKKPEEEEEAVTLLPEAVIEVTSKGYESKDLELAPRFYLSQGVKDVVVFDPYTLVVLHVRRGGAERHVSPVTLDLECGCQCTV